MNFEVWLAYLVTEFLLSLAPGPAVMLVLSHGLAAGVRAGRWSILGIDLANSVYFALSAAGLGAILLASATLFAIIKWTGIGYLIYTGIKMIRKAGESKAHMDRRAPAGRPFNITMQGFALQAGNPKALLFFAALLPQFVSPEGNMLNQFIIFGVTTVVIETVVLLVYAFLAERTSRLFSNQRAVMLQGRVSGGFLIAGALGLAAIRES